MEVSAKANLNIYEPFIELARKLLNDSELEFKEKFPLPVLKFAAKPTEQGDKKTTEDSPSSISQQFNQLNLGGPNDAPSGPTGFTSFPAANNSSFSPSVASSMFGSSMLGNNPTTFGSPVGFTSLTTSSPFSSLQLPTSSSPLQFTQPTGGFTPTSSPSHFPQPVGGFTLPSSSPSQFLQPGFTMPPFSAPPTFSPTTTSGFTMPSNPVPLQPIQPTQGPAVSPQSDAAKAKFASALDFLEVVKKTFVDRASVYQAFLDIMKDFKSQL